VADKYAQDYVQKLGDKLIPEFQKSLPVGDPNKIPFSFYLVESKTANAFALANGTVLVYSPFFSILENEAQLAAIIGHEIAHATQEHTYRQMQYHKKKLTALKIGAAVAAAYGRYSVSDLAKLVEAAVRNGYSRSLEDQADRLGLEYMIAAGYDPRQAPRVWKLMTKQYGDQSTDLFWSSHSNNTTRRSYLMAELKNNYSDLNYELLVTGDETFTHTAARLRQQGKKMKVKI
jgi:predicted Zn-dependent protease